MTAPASPPRCATSSTLGHRRIANVAGPSQFVHGDARQAAWRTVMLEAGLADDLALTADFTASGGATATAALLDLAEPPTAIVYANDVMAIAGMAVAASRGVSVPDQLSVTGFDDTELARHLSPALTTVRSDALGWGAAAAKLLLDVIEAGSARGPAPPQPQGPARHPHRAASRGARPPGQLRAPAASTVARPPRRATTNGVLHHPALDSPHVQQHRIGESMNRLTRTLPAATLATRTRTAQRLRRRLGWRAPPPAATRQPSRARSRSGCPTTPKSWPGARRWSPRGTPRTRRKRSPPRRSRPARARKRSSARRSPRATHRASSSTPHLRPCRSSRSRAGWCRWRTSRAPWTISRRDRARPSTSTSRPTASTTRSRGSPTPS